MAKLPRLVAANASNATVPGIIWRTIFDDTQMKAENNERSIRLQTSYGFGSVVEGFAIWHASAYASRAATPTGCRRRLAGWFVLVSGFSVWDANNDRLWMDCKCWREREMWGKFKPSIPERYAKNSCLISFFRGASLFWQPFHSFAPANLQSTTTSTFLLVAGF